MKTIMTTLLLVIISAFAKAQTPSTSQETYTLTVTVPNAKTNDGDMMFSLNTEANFMKGAPVQSASAEIKDGVATVTFENVPKGTYGILVLHDKNGNGQMDYEANGMPLEPYGMSNNPTSYGPPTWADAKFELNEDTALKIVI
ncbi:DUF2141 domain-containing protein [Nonlabens marinus]|uniref:DUF2141 domain-containing protein n=1 Tax=Nonlabens marinus S1-08 TaxID=1454201 RepID=W8VMS5_9FLAO|nr:DUF2141 domain-containing protein [Nonlabens marinus]BAO54024.1 hypothetical protein NMS_0015 [Nonlabens marinus S1-08]